MIINITTESMIIEISIAILFVIIIILISSQFKLVQDWLNTRTAWSQKKGLGGPSKKSQYVTHHHHHHHWYHRHHHHYHQHHRHHCHQEIKWCVSRVTHITLWPPFQCDAMQCIGGHHLLISVKADTRESERRLLGANLMWRLLFWWRVAASEINDRRQVTGWSMDKKRGKEYDQNLNELSTEGSILI